MSCWTKSLLTGLLLATAVVISGCYPLSSEHPLGHRSDGEDLVRNWAVDDIRLEVTRVGPQKLALKVMSQSKKDEAANDALYYEALPSTIDHVTYLSVRQVFPDEMVSALALKQDISEDEARANIARQDTRANGYYLARYRIAEKDGMLKLNVYLLDQRNKMALASIADGKLSGDTIKVTKMNGKKEEIVWVTSSSEDLDAYILETTDRNMSLFDLNVTGFINVY